MSCLHTSDNLESAFNTKTNSFPFVMQKNCKIPWKNWLLTLLFHCWLFQDKSLNAELTQRKKVCFVSAKQLRF